MMSFRRSGIFSTVAVIATCVASVAGAQSLREASAPAEFPPESYTSNQYVDSRGCVFVRAGISGSTNWVPRVSRDRQQLCGFQPTQVAGTTTTSPTANAPNPLDTPVAGLPPRTPETTPQAVETAPVTAIAPVARPEPPVQEPAPAPVVVAAPVAAPRASVPSTTSNTVNPLGTPRVSTPVAAAPVVVPAASPSPRIITAPVAAPQPRVLTRAEACEGLTGIQTNIVSRRTGQPIDCGGAPAPQVIAAAPAPVVAPQPTPRQRVSRAQACADSAASGRQYISATTGLPLTCGPEGQPVAAGTGALAQIQADLTRPIQPYSNPLDAAPGSTFVPNNRPRSIATRAPVPYSNPLDAAPGSVFTPDVNTRLMAACSYGDIVSYNGEAVRCGPQAQSPSGTTTNLVTRARTAPSQQGVVADILNQQPPPYSNPTRGYALSAPVVPDGYARVWGDGRLNAQRGLPVDSPSAGTVGYATSPTYEVQQPRVSTRVAPQPQRRVEQISGHRYVQVGTFASRDQAQAIAQTLRSRGLPMRIGVFNRNGREMRLVLAGPFSNDRQLQGALGTARGAGFSGAFTRR